MQNDSRREQLVAEVQEKMHFEVLYSEAAEANRAKIAARINELKDQAATGDYVSFQALYTMAFDASNALEQLATKHFDAIRPYARRKACWPVLCCPGNKILKEFKEFLNDIELGADWPIDLARFAKTQTVSREWLFRLIRKVDVVRHQQRAIRELEKVGLTQPESTDLCRRIGDLPELSRATMNQWFGICWELLLTHTNGQPESNEQLRAIGNDARARAFSGGSRETTIRDNIKKSLFQALERIIKR